MQGQYLLSTVLTLNQVAFPVHLLSCSEGRGNTDKPSLVINIISQLNDEFLRYDIDITQIPLTLDSWFVSELLRQQLYAFGFTDIIAGKGNYTFTIQNLKIIASAWKKELTLNLPKWGIDVSSRRIYAHNPTFGSGLLFLFRKSTARSYYLMNFSQHAMRGAEIWPIWKQHHQIICFWKTLKSVSHIHAMHLHGDGFYMGLLIKVLAYLLAIGLKAQRVFSKCSINQLMRQLSHDQELRDVLAEYFYGKYSVNPYTSA